MGENYLIDTIESLLKMVEIQHKRTSTKLFPVIIISGILSNIEILKNLPSKIKGEFLKLTPLGKNSIDKIKNYYIDHEKNNSLAATFFKNYKHANDFLYRLGMIPIRINEIFFKRLFLQLNNNKNQIIRKELTNKQIDQNF